MKLQAFLYLLIRDHLPTGVVERILSEVGKLNLMIEDDKYVVHPDFSSPQLADLAAEWAEDLVDE